MCFPLDANNLVISPAKTLTPTPMIQFNNNSYSDCRYDVYVTLLPCSSVEVLAESPVVYLLPLPPQQPTKSVHADSAHHHLIHASA